MTSRAFGPAPQSCRRDGIGSTLQAVSHNVWASSLGKNAQTYGLEHPQAIGIIIELLLSDVNNE